MAAEGGIRTHDRFEINPLYLFRWEETQQSHILLYPEGVIKLNETAGEILKRCTGEKSVGGIVDELKVIYTDPESNAGLEESLLEFLKVAREKGWIRLTP